MFEKVGRWAETVASSVSVSRRGFLGRLGQGALAAAGVLGGALLSARQAGAQSSGGVVCCYYLCRKPSNPYAYRSRTVCQKAGTTCAEFVGPSCGLYRWSPATSCQACSS
jgi:hypothetical protein